jgi:hypothetical protein
MAFNNMDHQKLRDPLKRKTVLSSSTMFLDHPDSAFDFRDMLVGAHQIEPWTTWHGTDQSREGCNFFVRMHHCDAKATMEIVLENLLERFEYLWDSPVPEMVHRREAYLATQH